MMRLLMILRVALKALNRNKMRTALTMLGMIIGVAAVIAMVALGKGAQSSIETQIKSAGTNIINVMSGNFMTMGVRQGSGASNTLTVEDAVAIRQTGADARSTSPPSVNTRNQIIAGNQNWQTRIQGTDVEFPLIRSWAAEVRVVLLQPGRHERGEGRGARARWSRRTSSARTSIRRARSSGSRTSRSRSSA